jgi:hypothetical protein
VFTGPGDQAVLDRVLAHTAADHGVPCPSMALIEQVVIATRPVAGEERRRLTLVGADPGTGPVIRPLGGSARSDRPGTAPQAWRRWPSQRTATASTSGSGSGRTGPLCCARSPTAPSSTTR